MTSRVRPSTWASGLALWLVMLVPRLVLKVTPLFSCGSTPSCSIRRMRSPLMLTLALKQSLTRVKMMRACSRRGPNTPMRMGSRPSNGIAFARPKLMRAMQSDFPACLETVAAISAPSFSTTLRVTRCAMASWNG